MSTTVRKTLLMLPEYYIGLRVLCNPVFPCVGDCKFCFTKNFIRDIRLTELLQPDMMDEKEKY